jgi:hypothetical protein
MIPIPACRYCDQGLQCGAEIQPNMTAESGDIPWGGKFYGGDDWINQVDCASICSGATVENGPPPPVNASSPTQYGLSDGQLCPPGVTQFPEVVPGLSGFLANHTYPERSIIAFSIVDKVIIPTNLPDGRYLLSWRWDCEQTYQIWQNCADIEIKGEVPRPIEQTDNWRVYFIIATSVLGATSVIAIAIVFYQCTLKRGKQNYLREPLKQRSVQ